jgi:hypothetical protein
LGYNKTMKGGIGKSTSGLYSLRMDDLARDLGDKGEEAFRERYPHPFLVVVYSPPAESDSRVTNTVETDNKDIDLNDKAATVKRIIPLLKSDRNEYRMKITVGRDLSSDIVIRSTKISRLHAAFVPRKRGVYQITDMGSANGTVVNGVRLNAEQSVRLKSGDMVALWRYLFQFVELDPFLVMLKGV